MLSFRLPRQFAVLALTCVVCLACAAPSFARTAMHWSAPRQIDTAQVPGGGGSLLTDISCPSTRLCVAVDADGNVLTDTHPGTAGSKWTVTHLTTTSLDVSCPTASWCFVADSSGDVFHSDRPTAGAAAWTEQQITGPVDTDDGAEGVGLSALACPSTSFCITGSGDTYAEYVSTAPTSDAAWTSLDTWGGVFEFNATDMSCPSVSFCVGVSSTGYGSGSQIVATTKPAVNLKEDSLPITTLETVVPNGLSCPTTAFCAIAAEGNVDSRNGYVLTSHRPKVANTWHQVKITHHALADIACPTAGFCVAADQDGSLLWSSDPTGAASTWSITAHADSAKRPITSIACPSSTLCLAVDSGGYLITGTRS